MWLKWLCISLLGALICLDNVSVGQFMISRPICCGPLMGWILGDIKTGLMVGALLEILWISPIPVGAYVLPGIESSCIVATAIAIEISRAGQIGKLSIIGLAICFSLPIAQVGQFAGVLARRINNRISGLAIRFADRSDCLFPWLGLGLLVFYISYFLTCFLGLSISFPVAEFLIPKLTPGMLKGLALVTLWCPVLGLATVVKKAGEKHKYYLLIVGFGLALVLKEFFPKRGLAAFSVSMVTIVCVYTWISLHRSRIFQK